MSARPELPTGTVTFLFTDIEGSTALVQRLGAGFGSVVEDHHRLLRDAIRGAGGVDLRTEGDAFFAVFESAPAAVAAAVAGQRGLAAHPWPEGAAVRVRMGLHTGEGVLGADDYLGLDVHLAARIGAAAHGGQVVVSDATRALAEGSLPEGSRLLDLGEHRLKDFPDPYRLFQVGVDDEDAFPPLRTIGGRTNLPEPPTSFVGREAELASLRERIGSARLVTLTGPGGTGKTRLAIEASSALASSFRDGAAFVDLAVLDDARLVPAAIVGGLGLRSVSGPPFDAVVAYLRDREVLLVLDNFEQVMAAADEVGRLLASAPGLKVVVTSRSPLSLRGEAEFPVPPFRVTDGSNGPGVSEAVRLFAERAAAVDPGFSLDGNAAAIAEICRRLDGLPLAIELAASRTRVLSPADLLDRLERRLPTLVGGPRDAPERQRALRETIGWSYDLLGEDERALFRNLSVFAGGWSLEAAEAVANPDGAAGDTLDGLGILVQASMVRRQPGAAGGRFDMLETIREYGQERLDASEDSGAVRARHGERFLGLAAESAPYLLGDDLERRLDLLATEHDNLRAALTWALREDRGEPALRAVAGVWRFWQFRGHLAEGRRWAGDVLSLPSSAPRTAVRADALIAAAGLAYWQGEYGPMEDAYRETHAIGVELGDARVQGEALFGLSFSSVMENDQATAERLLNESQDRFTEARDVGGLGRVRMAMAFVATQRRDMPEVRRLASEAADLLLEAGDLNAWTDATQMLAQGAAIEGDLREGGALMRTSLERSLRAGLRSGVVASLEAAGYLANQRGDHAMAARLASAGDALGETLGLVLPQGLRRSLRVREAAREALGAAAFEEQWNEGRALTFDEAVTLAFAMFDGKIPA